MWCRFSEGMEEEREREGEGVPYTEGYPMTRALVLHITLLGQK